jgi:uncharacterized protein (TIRG00374 family)
MSVRPDIRHRTSRSARWASLGVAPLARWVRTVGALVLTIAAVEYGLVPRIVQAKAELSLLHDVSPGLLVAALLLEACSLLAYTGMTQQLLSPGPALPWGTQLRIDLTGYGMSHVLPGGGATAAALRYRLMVLRGIPRAATLSLTAVEAVRAALGLVVVWLLGSVASLPRTGITATTVGLVVLCLLAVLVVHRLGTGGAELDVVARWLRRLPSGLRQRVTTTLTRSRAAVADTPSVWRAVTWSTANWLLDAVCLWLCLSAYGAVLPLELVLLAYGVASAVGLLPVTPGGIGVIEAVLVPGLIAAGAPAGPALLGVLTWRLCQFWLPIPVAAVCWASLAHVRKAPGESGRGGQAAGEHSAHHLLADFETARGGDPAHRPD